MKKILLPLILILITTGCTNTAGIKKKTENKKTQQSKQEQQFNNSGRAKAIVDDSDMTNMTDEQKKTLRLKLLNGKWKSADDSKSIIVFSNDKKIDYYNGSKMNENKFKLDGDYLLVGEGDNIFKYKLIKITGTNLELMYLPKGNLLKYSKISKVITDDTKKITYQYIGNLVDVTKSKKIRGVVTGDKTTGVAKAMFKDGKYFMTATFKDLPDPVGDDFYEGWIVKKSPLSVLSTGKAIKKDDVYVNSFFSDKDLTDHDFYVLTLEPNDKNPAPADHIVEGTMKKL